MVKLAPIGKNTYEYHTTESNDLMVDSLKIINGISDVIKINRYKLVLIIGDLFSTSDIEKNIDTYVKGILKDTMLKG